jgi:hypothetical protein
MRTDPETGKNSFTRVHWGKVTEDLVFIPNNRFKLATPEELDRLVFPPQWDLSAIEELKEQEQPKVPGRGRPSYTGDDVNRLYGDIWFLEQIARSTGLEADLKEVFGRDRQAVADLLTLAFFPYLTGYSYNRGERWQRICKTPSTRPLTPEAVTCFFQGLTEQHRMDLFRLRQKRLKTQEFLAVDSTSRSCYGNSIASIRWGKSKEHDPLQQTNELVVYGLDSHMPVFYQQLPGNIPDSRTVELLVSELDHAGFESVALVMDRGYSSVAVLELLLKHDRPFVMCSKTNWSLVSQEISELDLSSGKPEGFCVDAQYRLYHYQKPLSYTLKMNGGGYRAVKGLNVNLYFDPERRGKDLIQIDIDIAYQQQELDQLLQKQLEVVEKELKRCFPYYTVSLDECGTHVSSCERNEKAITDALKRSGFISILSYSIEGDSKQVWDWYHLRDEQEKLFTQLKTSMRMRRTRSWTEESYEGRLLVEFVALTISSQVKHLWKHTALHEKFRTSSGILDEMRSIRCVEHHKRAKKITPFVGKQIDICEACGFTIPKGCAPASRTKKKSSKAKKEKTS